MAGAFIAGLAGDVFTNTVGSLVNAGANAINQKVDFENNKYLQNASFNHDKEMLNAQIEATKRLQADMIAIKQGVLTAGGFSPTDAARGAINAPMTKVLDWNGTSTGHQMPPLQPRCRVASQTRLCTELRQILK